MSEKRVIAVFHPQRWVWNYAIEVDPEGDTAFDVTDMIEEMGRDKALEIRDETFDSDCLRHSSNAPGWALNWDGPFWIEVEDSIDAYYS